MPILELVAFPVPGTTYNQTIVDSLGVADVRVPQRVQGSRFPPSPSYPMDPPNPRDPWFIEGWTIQNPLVGPTAPVLPGLLLPSDITLVNVTASYVSFTGYPPFGVVVFKPSGPMTDLASNTVILPQEIRSPVVAGRLSVMLPASGDPDAPGAFTYHVTEVFEGGTSYDIRVPFDATTPVDIHALVV